MNMEQMLAALADPQRRQIVELLLVRDRPVRDLVERLPIAQSGVSRHLRILRGAGLVRSRAEGQRRIYSLCPEPLEELSSWLESIRLVWELRLDNFERELDRRMEKK